MTLYGFIKTSLFISAAVVAVGLYSELSKPRASSPVHLSRDNNFPLVNRDSAGWVARETPKDGFFAVSGAEVANNGSLNNIVVRTSFDGAMISLNLFSDTGFLQQKEEVEVELDGHGKGIVVLDAVAINEAKVAANSAVTPSQIEDALALLKASTNLTVSIKGTQFEHITIYDMSNSAKSIRQAVPVL